MSQTDHEETGGSAAGCGGEKRQGLPQSKVLRTHWLEAEGGQRLNKNLTLPAAHPYHQSRTPTFYVGAKNSETLSGFMLFWHGKPGVCRRFALATPGSHAESRWDSLESVVRELTCQKMSKL